MSRDRTKMNALDPAGGTPGQVPVVDSTGTRLVFGTPTSSLTAEDVRDTIAAALRAGTGVTITVDDAGDTITVSAAGTTDPEVVRDTIAAALRAGTNVTITTDDAADTITIAAATDPEVVRDTIGAALVAGSGVTIAVDDAANTIAISASGGTASAVYHYRERITADPSDQILTLGATPVPGSPLVWVNGAIKWPGVDYTISGATITFPTPMTGGEVVTVHWQSANAAPAAATFLASGIVAVTVRDSSAVATTTNTAAVVIPATAQVGDLAVVSLADSWGSNNIPAGWTRLFTDTGSNQNGAVFYKVLVSGDPGSTVNFTMGGADQGTAICVVLQGSHQGAAVTMWETRFTSGGTVTSPTHSAADKDILLHLGHWRSAPAFGTADKGTLLRTTSAGTGRAAAYTQPISGTVSQTVTWTQASSSGYFYATIKVKAVGN